MLTKIQLKSFFFSINVFINWMKEVNVIFERIATKEQVRIQQNLYTVYY